LTKFDSFRISSGSTFNAILGIVALVAEAGFPRPVPAGLSSGKKMPAA
jgi:hypothetical protein